jgi:hypothetical protein
MMRDRLSAIRMYLPTTRLSNTSCGSPGSTSPRDMATVKSACLVHQLHSRQPVYGQVGDLILEQEVQLCDVLECENNFRCECVDILVGCVRKKGTYAVCRSLVIFFDLGLEVHSFFLGGVGGG